LRKKTLNAEIRQQAGMGHTDQIMPSEINARDRLAGLGAMNDEVMKEHILAKKALNAEIKDHIGTSQADHIVPSEIAAVIVPPAPISTEMSGVPLAKEITTPEVVEEHPHLSTTEKFKEKVRDAAHSIKETFKGLH